MYKRFLNFSRYLLNDLVWCGSKTSPDGLNYDYCKESSNNCNAMHPAWYEASAKVWDL